MDLTEIYFNIKENHEELKDYTPVPPNYRHLLIPGVLVKYCGINSKDMIFSEGVVKNKTIDSLYIKVKDKSKPKVIKMSRYFIFYKIDDNNIMMKILNDIADEL